jgi:probable HAF family extracellular repeat protein
MKRKSLTVLLFAFALAPTCLAAKEKISRYEVSDLGTLGGVRSVACGLNNRGEVTGISPVAAGPEHAFVWRDGVMTDLGILLGDLSSTGVGINNSGQVAGSSSPTSTMNQAPYDAVLWDNGEIIPLGTLGGLFGGALAINERGQVTGFARTAAGEVHAFLWEEDSGMTDLGTLPGGGGGIGRGINNRAQVVGQEDGSGFGHCGADAQPLLLPGAAVMWGGDGTITDLGTLGGIFAIAKSINDRGVVVGASSTAREEIHAFLWQDGTMTDLGTLGGTYSGAWQINQRDQVVGHAYTGTGELHAFLWAHGRMTDLNGLIRKRSGWILTTAAAINKAGQIAGWGEIGGQTHAFLLTPERDDD